jgi:predicted SprT family Zn-dependent metalloprotease
MNGSPDTSFNLHPAEILRRLTQDARELALGLALPVLSSRVTLSWHQRLRTTAGLARLDCSLILLNPRLLAHPAELRRTFLHELAHLVAHARNPRRLIDPHGPEWRQACRDLGLGEEKRCHNLVLAPPRQVTRRFRYHCPHCRREMARVRPFRHGEACLHCCRGESAGRYDRRFRFQPGPAPVERHTMQQAELFLL